LTFFYFIDAYNSGSYEPAGYLSFTDCFSGELKLAIFLPLV